MKSRTNGFTMIELIVVITILGILSAIALPRFINLRGDANDAAVAGVAGAAASAMSLNFAGCSLDNNVATARCVPAITCAAIGSILQGGLPTGYTASGTSPTCVMTLTNSATSGATPAFAASAAFAGM